MKPIFWFVVVSTSATGALLVAMGSQGVGLIVCVVGVGLYQWFRMGRYQAENRRAPRADERHDIAGSGQPATLSVIRRTTGGAT